MSNSNDQTDEGKPRNQPEQEKNDLKHVVQTGLPPGIQPDEAKDPGTHVREKGPVDNRS